jgi:L-ascorbate metabolism protein UlaG (beta-lactamase superfamily)
MVRINLRSSLITLIILFAALCPAAFGKIIYVDDDATGANDGSSWENACVYLQDALAAANLFEKPLEVRVAQGTYRPNQGLMAIPEFDWRTTTFQLINGVTLKGGYAGSSQPDPNARDIELYGTILSGDLNGDDVQVADPCDLPDEPTRAENSYRVVSGNRVDATAVLDGFTITAGNASGPFPYDYGGGMYNYISSPTLTGCTFSGNSAGHDGEGGGIYNVASSPTLTNCILEGNWANNGGGMLNDDSSNPSLSGCTLSRNSAQRGGAMHNYKSAPTLADCAFSRNWAYYGGGMYNYESSPVLTGCRFSGNSAPLGGGMYNNRSSPALTNCIFAGNSASAGGGIDNYPQNSPTVVNCTFVGNSAKDGSGLACFSSGQDDASMLVLTNCILRDVGAEISNDGPSIVNVAYSNVQGGWPGEGNIDIDPLFADPGYWADANDPNVVVEPRDPNAVWIDGDYHLKSQAGRWDQVSESWVIDDVTSPCIDAGDPNSPVGDEPEPNGGRINMGAYGGTAEASKSLAGVKIIVYVQWLGHSSVKVWTNDCIVYVDPERVPESLHDATLVCVTHTHGDHYSPSDIAKVSNAGTKFIAPPEVVRQYGKGENIAPGQTMEFDFVNIKAVPSYNINKSNHLKSSNWVGYIIELGGKRIYVAGDTDLIEEMKSLGDINVAFLPAGGTYTMNATEAAQATEYIKPDLAIPYHWGQSVGTLADAQRFAELAQCPAMVLTVGEMISSDNWPEYSPLIAHWALDEAEGNIAQDIAGDNHGTLSGGPAWQPAAGKIAGAIELDGIDDYISTNFVLDPANGPFSVFAWIKGGALYQVIISQADILAGRSIKPGSIWLCVDPLDGKLMTYCGLASAGSPIPPAPLLVSESVITDGQWHHVGFVWDGSYRSLYVDGIEAARDTAAQNPLQSATSGLRIGAGKALDAATFFSGLIDDVRIYNVALTADEIETLVR